MGNLTLKPLEKPEPKAKCGGPDIKMIPLALVGGPQRKLTERKLTLVMLFS